MLATVLSGDLVRVGFNTSSTLFCCAFNSEFVASVTSGVNNFVVVSASNFCVSSNLIIRWVFFVSNDVVIGTSRPLNSNELVRVVSVSQVLDCSTGLADFRACSHRVFGFTAVVAAIDLEAVLHSRVDVSEGEVGFPGGFLNWVLAIVRGDNDGVVASLVEAS
jgi:hypothetical protein